jgi:hypothetical protein
MVSGQIPGRKQVRLEARLTLKEGGLFDSLRVS